MQVDLERIFERANEKLSFSPSQIDPAFLVSESRQFLKLENHRLKTWLRFGHSALETARARSYMLDLLITRLSNTLSAQVRSFWKVTPEDYSIIAVGGFGRQEMAPYSDVDILFLHRKTKHEGVQLFAEKLQHLLWDIGLSVGHSFRSIQDCVEIAKNDLHSSTSLMNARFLTGNPEAFYHLAAELDRHVYRNAQVRKELLKEIDAHLKNRYARYQNKVCLQEPHLKEGVGGLRDFHTILWHACLLYGSRTLEDLQSGGLIGASEYSQLIRCIHLLLRMRSEIHLISGRKSDVLTLDLQPLVASALGYRDTRTFLASERMMRDYYERAQDLHRFCEKFLYYGDIRSPEAPTTSMDIGRARQTFGKFVVRDGKLYAKSGQKFQPTTDSLLEAFCLSQQRGALLSESLRFAIRTFTMRSRPVLPLPLKSAKKVFGIFQKAGDVAKTVRAMHETGFLSHLFPEFSRIKFLVQHDLYHKYTVDEHTLQALENLDRVSDDSQNENDSAFQKLFREIEDIGVLYFALFLHDIGKGRHRSHVQEGTKIARKICERLELESHRSAQIQFLIANHLLMSSLALRRDLSDYKVTSEFAAKVGTVELLNLLMLLTYCDICAVGPEIWNDWKATMLWELYSRSRKHLEASSFELPANQDSLNLQQCIAELSSEFSSLEIQDHLSSLPSRYLQATKTTDIGIHLRMVRQVNPRPLRTQWKVLADEMATELTICTHDRPGLFALLAGTLSFSGINILSADLFTRSDGMVIDVLNLCNIQTGKAVPAKSSDAVTRKFESALAGELDVSKTFEQWRSRILLQRKRQDRFSFVKPSIQFDNHTSEACTILEVKVQDEPGLAFQISSKLATLGVNIVFAKIATEKRFAVDVFYVTDSNGRKLKPSDLEQIERQLLALFLATRNFRDQAHRSDESVELINV
jgi:[protein-PII] uridylyltransferase